ncbi:dynamin family protein [Pseudonocardia sp.]|uniref:dynamin family protein n=1 Tax=Pseudonocardia sp. TaxID=60912 RepID=UPI003D12BD16
MSTAAPAAASSTAPSNRPARDEPVAVVDLALACLAGHDRPDLTARLQAARARLLDEHVRVLVVGEFKKGKSMLVNGLVGAPVCPTFDDVATAVTTVVRHADAVSLTLVRITGTGEERRVERVTAPAEELADHVTEQGNPGNRAGWSHVEIAVPRPLLAGGLELVDTPGVGGLTSVHGAATTAALPSADAVLLISDASQEYTAPELEFLGHAASVCPNVACVLTKNDLYPEWERIAELDRAHLADAGISAELYAVSSTLRWHAVLHGDQEANQESGFPALVGYLRNRVLGQADRIARRSTVHDVLAVTDQLAGMLRAELAAVRDPDAVKDLVAELAAAQERATALKERSARWQTTLNDGIADLNADIDYDLRDRMRDITRAAEEEIDGGGDPTKVWDQITAWVEQEVTSAASANFVWSTQRARALAARVAEHFAGEREPLMPVLRQDESDALRSVRAISVRASDPWTAGQKALTGLRGGYSAMVMFGMLSTFVGFASVINPLSVGAALFMSGKAVGDERKRLVTKRRNDAKTAIRRHVDDVTFQLTADTRTRLRGIQRELRDHFTEQADQLKRSLAESQQSADRALRASKAEREARIPVLTAELEKVEKARRAARALLPGTGS